MAAMRIADAEDVFVRQHLCPPEDSERVQFSLRSRERIPKRIIRWGAEMIKDSFRSLSAVLINHQFIRRSDERCHIFGYFSHRPRSANEVAQHKVGALNKEIVGVVTILFVVIDILFGDGIFEDQRDIPDGIRATGKGFRERNDGKRIARAFSDFAKPS